jgi:hypothetical protein
MNNTSAVVYRRMMPRYNMMFVPYTDDSECAFLMQAHRAGEMYFAFLKNRSDKVEIVFEEERKGPSEDTKKLASPASLNVKYEESDDDDGFYGDLRNFVQPLAQIDLSKIKWSDFLSDSNDEAAGGSEQNDKEY